MNFGARMLKTGIAVTLALYLTMLLNLTPPVIAAIAAIFAMQPSIYKSWRYFLDQLLTNTLGAVIAMLAGMLLSSEPIAVGLTCIVVIMVCLKINRADTIGLTLVTVISVMEASGQFHFALNRFLINVIGIFAAFIVNVLVLPPKPKEQFLGQIQSTFGHLSLLLRTAVSDEIKEGVFKDEQRGLDGSIQSLAEKYNLLEEDQHKRKRPSYTESRHLVVYKQMLRALRKGSEVVQAVEEHYFPASRSLELDTLFDERLEYMTKYHEHVLLKFENKLKPDESPWQNIEEENERFALDMKRYLQQQEESTMRLSIVTAEIHAYGYQLVRLNRLVEHYGQNADRGEKKRWTYWINPKHWLG
ncbi:aromatic acid exporter family protein [Saccharibacillus sp. CPCC 101409]|nr:aromatic acid exporter family protein [Saccharibacillus sp. CPCC 101409]MDO3410785.1 aromatic acid exporter family protein [Saccharibacillus sp. CPCC 101409]